MQTCAASGIVTSLNENTQKVINMHTVKTKYDRSNELARNHLSKILTDRDYNLSYLNNDHTLFNFETEEEAKEKAQEMRCPELGIHTQLVK